MHYNNIIHVNSYTFNKVQFNAELILNVLTLINVELSNVLTQDASGLLRLCCCGSFNAPSQTEVNILTLTKKNSVKLPKRHSTHLNTHLHTTYT